MCNFRWVGASAGFKCDAPCRFLRMFVIKEHLPINLAADAGWCIAFLGYWEKSVRDYRQLTLKVS